LNIKCFFGFHDWEYKKFKTRTRYPFTPFYPSRFCKNCFKKQQKVRFDMEFIWTDIQQLEKDEIRFMNLKKLLKKK
jgi:hypothetical protein